MCCNFIPKQDISIREEGVKKRKTWQYCCFNPIQNGSFWGCLRRGAGQKAPYLNCITFNDKTWHIIPWDINHLRHPSSSVDINLFQQKSENFVIFWNKDKKLLWSTWLQFWLCQQKWLLQPSLNNCILK